LRIKGTITTNFAIRVLVFTAVLLIFITISLIWNFKAKFLNEITSIAVFYSAYLITPSLHLDKVSIVSPKNLMLLVFFMRLVICPVTILITGQQSWKLPAEPTHEDLYLVHLITFVAFYAFVSGWDLLRRASPGEERPPSPGMKFRNNAVIALFLFGSLLFVVYGYYGSLNGYLASIFVEDYDASREGQGKLLIYISIILRYVIPFLGVILGLVFIHKIKSGIWVRAITAFLFIIIIVFLGLSPSRNNMIFPVLSFLAACIPIYFRIKFRDFLLGAAGFLILLFLFQNIRKRENAPMIEELNRVEKFVEFVQVYFVAPHIMTPLVTIVENADTIPFTLHSSLLESIPVLGAPFRQKSGSYVYNVAYGRAVGPDQVFPTYGEVFFNLGMIGLIFVFMLTGFIYRKLDRFFMIDTTNDPFLRSLVFYLSLLFNATIFYSYSVLGQFFYYNSILIFAMLIFRDRIGTNNA